MTRWASSLAVFLFLVGCRSVHVPEFAVFLFSFAFVLSLLGGSR